MDTGEVMDEGPVWAYIALGVIGFLIICAMMAAWMALWSDTCGCSTPPVDKSEYDSDEYDYDVNYDLDYDTTDYTQDANQLLLKAQREHQELRNIVEEMEEIVQPWQDIEQKIGHNTERNIEHNRSEGPAWPDHDMTRSGPSYADYDIIQHDPSCPRIAQQLNTLNSLIQSVNGSHGHVESTDNSHCYLEPISDTNGYLESAHNYTDLPNHYTNSANAEPFYPNNLPSRSSYAGYIHIGPYNEDNHSSHTLHRSYQLTDSGMELCERHRTSMHSPNHSPKRSPKRSPNHSPSRVVPRLTVTQSTSAPENAALMWAPSGGLKPHNSNIMTPVTTFHMDQYIPNIVYDRESQV